MIFFFQNRLQTSADRLWRIHTVMQANTYGHAGKYIRSCKQVCTFIQANTTGHVGEYDRSCRRIRLALQVDWAGFAGRLGWAYKQVWLDEHFNGL